VTEAVAPSWRARPGPVVGACVLVYLPFALLGYGTDLDVANVLRAGRSWVDEGSYDMSRGPGAAVHELGVGLLDHLGGSVLLNLASVGFAALALWSVFTLVQRDGGRWPEWSVLVLASNPWFWIAATSLGDFVWALGLLLAGAVLAGRPVTRTASAPVEISVSHGRTGPAARAGGAEAGPSPADVAESYDGGGRPVLAGVLFGLAIGCRASSALLVLAWCAGELLGADGWRVHRRRVAWAGGIALLVGVLCFVPPWWDAGRSWDFLDNELEFVGLGVHLGRWAVKNLALVGPLAGIVLLLGIPKALAALGRWSTSALVRFSALVIIVSELLYFRFPFKPMHLLPVVAATALLVGASPLVTKRWVIALVVAQLIGGLVSATFAAPDVQDAARSGRVDVSITAGPLLTDVRCRFDDRDLGPWPDPATLAATVRAGVNAACQNRTWRAD